MIGISEIRRIAYVFIIRESSHAPLLDGRERRPGEVRQAHEAGRLEGVVEEHRHDVLQVLDALARGLSAARGVLSARRAADLRTVSAALANYYERTGAYPGVS